ncbi:hypothetical protein Pmar_PMAR021698 [Perkinsus marinus ATCC 50983]|uniref:Uncharacterized protein n=1 Tax=Perkinsus marinus (strain ATCC 50983 / TXsc) TaxID=423536 RepID=C5L2F5_PERM5|nr:hypothetical protein Pmar_PMAR021698 [Perkinsus marinus ATCC 50983]EER09049.1 hypothetical protein Pmar_PMAR021698 [Perkinsus marinus ATCC 50983]|eukprot:XP_002777233.1 hypothetical protein Pmar_PMAR021698 [Perkinsus marinus ATCC 50983]
MRDGRGAEGVLLRISKCRFDNDWDRPGRALGTILASVIPVGVSPEVRKSVISKSYQLANSSYLSPKIVTQRSGELIGVACALLSFRLHGVTPIHQMDVVGGKFLYVRSADDWYSVIADLPTGGKLLLGPAPVFAVS